MDRLAKHEDAEHIARRAVKALELPIRLDGVDLHTSASIGIAMFPADGKSAEALIANADAAMYCAKQRGRNNIQCYAEGMNSDPGAGEAGERPAPGALAQAARAALPAEGRHQDRPHSRRRGAGTLAASAAGPRAAGGIHPAGGVVRADRRDRRVGGARELPAGARLAARGATAAARSGQSVGVPVPAREPPRSEERRVGKVSSHSM